MAHQLFQLPKQLNISSSFTLSAGAKAYFFEPGTTTPRDTYTTSALSVAHPHPVVADAAGVLPPIYLDPSLQYKLTLKTSADALIYTVDPVNDQVLTQALIGQTLYPRTDAEISASVTPTALYRAPDRGYDVRRTGVTLDGTTDDTADFQDAVNACNGRLYIPNGTIKITSAVSIPAGTEIWCDVGATINASGVDYSALRALGSLTVTGLKMTRTDTAQNTSYKAIHADNSLAALAANTRIVVRDCVITGFDIGIYTDGGSSQNINYLEVSGSRIIINNLGTGGSSSVRPTVTGNNCKRVSIRNNFLDASDVDDAVNNIYCIGSSKVDVSENYLLRGHAVKVLSNSVNAVEHLRVNGNWIKGATLALMCQADAQPLRLVEFVDNFVDAPISNVSDVGCVYLGILNTVSGAKAFETVIARGNHFRDVPYSVWYPVMTTGNTFGSLVLSDNVYRNTSTGSSGTYSVVNHGSAGTYDELSCANEVVVGNSNTRSYLQDRGNFTTISVSRVTETGITGTPSGFDQLTATLTLTGCTTSPTGTLTYKVHDDWAHATLPQILATSNTTAATLTGIPAAIRPAANRVCVGTTQDNGVNAVSLLRVDTGGTITLFFGVTATFTGSGTKGIGDCEISWRIN